jgi:hypothetical protein
MLLLSTLWPLFHLPTLVVGYDLFLTSLWLSLGGWSINFAIAAVDPFPPFHLWLCNFLPPSLQTYSTFNLVSFARLSYLYGSALQLPPSAFLFLQHPAFTVYTPPASNLILSSSSNLQPQPFTLLP